MLVPPNISPTSVVARAREVKFNQLDDEYYAVDSKAGYFYNMNETGSRIWELIASPISVNELCAQLQNEYHVDAEMCSRQVTKILLQLCALGLIRITEATLA